MSKKPSERIEELISNSYYDRDSWEANFNALISYLDEEWEKNKLKKDDAYEQSMP